MLRAILKGEKPRFGMIMYPSQEGVVVNYGTMLDIKSVKILSDGRSVIETWGTDRFRLVKRGERDGYMVGKIETYVSAHTLQYIFPLRHVIIGSRTFQRLWRGRLKRMQRCIYLPERRPSSPWQTPWKYLG